MAAPDHESIASRAYRLWEENGRPPGRDLDFWLEAEAEAELGADRRSGAPLRPEKIPAPTNLDRALPVPERMRARALRHERGERPLVEEAGAPKHFIVVLDRAHLNVFQVREGEGRTRARFEQVDAFHLPDGLQSYTARDTDRAGRFTARGGPGGGSIDERLPMQEEHEHRLAAELAGHLGRFLRKHEHAVWDFAAGPALHRAVLDRLPPEVRARLDRALPLELVNQTPAELEAHFTP